MELQDLVFAMLSFSFFFFPAVPHFRSIPSLQGENFSLWEYILEVHEYVFLFHKGVQMKDYFES